MATLRNRKAKLFVDTVSLTYIVAMINRLMNIQRELIFVCCTIDQIPGLGNIALRRNIMSIGCQKQIHEYWQELVRHRTMNV